MAKTEPLLSPSQFTMGYYEWNNQMNALEYKSLDPSTDSKDRRQKADIFSTRGKINTSTKNGGPPTRNRGSPKLTNMKNSEITLDDVKHVAMEHLVSDHDNNSTIPSKSFRDLSKTDQFDEFLITLLHYFNCFFEHLEYAEKPQKSSYLHPSKAELQALAEAKQKLEVTRRSLGQTYCILILGLGLEKQHHMGCGKKRVSSTHKDKKMYEDFYLFCTYVVWITFHRKKMKMVKVEVGNMLRSSIFNPALQPKQSSTIETNKKNITTPVHKPSKRKGNQKATVAERVEELLSAKLPQMDRLTPAEHRRKNGKRPAIMKSIHQRSSALISLLPMPKEESSYLFTQTAVHPKDSQNIEQQGYNKLTLSQLPEKIGIIGENKNSYTESLIPKINENEDTDGDFIEENQNASRVSNQQNRTDAISRATTIADL